MSNQNADEYQADRRPKPDIFQELNDIFNAPLGHRGDGELDTDGISEIVNIAVIGQPELDNLEGERQVVQTTLDGADGTESGALLLEAVILFVCFPILNHNLKLIIHRFVPCCLIDVASN